jgi:hypothetical protein
LNTIWAFCLLWYQVRAAYPGEIPANCRECNANR